MLEAREHRLYAACPPGGLYAGRTQSIGGAGEADRSTETVYPGARGRAGLPRCFAGGRRRRPVCCGQSGRQTGSE